MAKSGSEITKKSTAKRRVRSTSFSFNPEEMALLEAMTERFGGKKAAVIAGLEALQRRNDLTKADVLAAIETNWRDQ